MTLELWQTPLRGAMRAVGIADAFGRTVEATGFGELRTAQPLTLVDLMHQYQVDPTEWASTATGGGTVAHVPAHQAARLSVDGASGADARLRTITRFRYQPGRYQQVRMSMIHSDAGQANQIREWGYINDTDGLAFELSGTTLYALRRSSASGSVIETRMPITLDRRIDSIVLPAASAADLATDGIIANPLDGTNGPLWAQAQLHELLMGHGHIFEIEFQWLGVGSVLWKIDGVLVAVMDFSGKLPEPYMRTANLPVSYRVRNVDTSAAGWMENICTSVSSLGGEAPTQYSYAAGQAADATVGQTLVPLFSLHPALLFNAIANRIILLPQTVFVRNTGGRCAWRLVMNPTLTGASWTAVNAQSAAQYDVSASAYTGGQEVARGGTGNPTDSDARDLGQVFNQLGRKLRLSDDGTTSDILSVVGVNEATRNNIMRAGLAWAEVR